MKKQTFTLLFLLLTLFVYGQQTIDFEGQLNLPDTFLNGSDGSGDFVIDPLIFPNEYDFQNDFWSGQWAMSSSKDSVTPNFTNLYGSIEGEGRNGSDVYAIGQKDLYTGQLSITGNSPIIPQDAYITNTTYAYYTIRDGNQFSKAFGGPTGEDPDYFYIRWKGFLNGQLQHEEDFYLADYRFQESSEDYIVKEWTRFDLSGMGMVDSLEIEFYSSDTGDFGINTPLFFALDDFTYENTSSGSDRYVSDLKIYPNPVTSELRWHDQEPLKNVEIWDVSGRLHYRGSNILSIPVKELAPGFYLLKWEKAGELGMSKFLKN